MNYTKILISCVLPLSITACSVLPNSLNPMSSVNSFQATQTIGRFQIQDNLVLDSTSNLMWSRCLLGASWNGYSCSGKAQLYGWQQAQSVSRNLKYAGFNDWRIPTLEELKTLDEKQMTTSKAAIPHLNQAVFPIPDCHGYDDGLSLNSHLCWQWTSSRIEGSDHYAWIVYFSYGYGSANYDIDTFALRLVRNHR